MPNGPSGGHSITCILCRMIVVNEISKPESGNVAHRKCEACPYERIGQIKRSKHQGLDTYTLDTKQCTLPTIKVSCSYICQTAISGNAAASSERIGATNNTSVG